MGENYIVKYVYKTADSLVSGQLEYQTEQEARQEIEHLKSTRELTYLAIEVNKTLIGY